MISINKLTPAFRTTLCSSRPILHCQFIAFSKTSFRLQRNVFASSKTSYNTCGTSPLKFNSQFTIRSSRDVIPRSTFSTSSTAVLLSSADINKLSRNGEDETRNRDSADAEAETNAEIPSSNEANTESRRDDTALEGNILEEEDMKTLSGGDPQIENKIRFILMEIDLMRQDGIRVPSKILMKYWPELLTISSKGQRLKFYGYLWNIEMAKISTKRKREVKLQKRLEEYAANPLPPLHEDPHCMTYGLNRNTLFLRLYDTKITSFYHHRIISEMVLGSAPLVIDCGYDDQMVMRESKNCASQLELVIAENRAHPQPFNLSFCNANPSSNTINFLKKRIPVLYDDDFALNIQEKGYLDLYPREKLVYLSPHAREELTEFDDDEIYIIGAIVDKSDPRPFSVAKAKKEGIRMKKLPLDSRVDWGLGNKSLTINQLVCIMLEIRATRDWDKALRFIPKRKLIGGRKECPPRSGFTPPAPFRGRPASNQSQVFKDFELVAQRRRGFVYQGREDEQYGRDQHSGSKGPRPREQTGRHQGYVKRDLRTIMSDMD